MFHNGLLFLVMLGCLHWVVSCDGKCTQDPVLDWTGRLIDKGWFACSSSTIVMDELVAKGGV
jgi:hypothetical protein